MSESFSKIPLTVSIHTREFIQDQRGWWHPVRLWRRVSCWLEELSGITELRRQLYDSERENRRLKAAVTQLHESILRGIKEREQKPVLPEASDLSPLP